MNRKKALKKLFSIVEQSGEALFPRSEKESVRVNEKPSAEELVQKSEKRSTRLLESFSKRSVEPLYKLDFGVAAKLFLTASLVAPVVVWNVKNYMSGIHNDWAKSIENVSSFDSYSTRGDEELLKRADKLIEQLKNKKAQEIIKKATGRDLIVIGDKDAIALFGQMPDNVDSIISRFDKDDGALFFARDKEGNVYVVSIAPDKTSVYAIEEDGGIRPLEKSTGVKKGIKKGIRRSGILCPIA